MRFPCKHNYWLELADPNRKSELKRISCALLSCALVMGGCTGDAGDDQPGGNDYTPTLLPSLNDLTIESLRARSFGSEIQPEERIGETTRENATTVLASYDSDDHRVYVRIDIPIRQAPESGFPVLIFVHGWYGIEGAPDFDFFQDPDSQYAKLVEYYVDAGFVVLSPGLRGHGTVKGIPAEGIDTLQQWDNGSYLSPMFYAIDVLNLLDGIDSIQASDWSQWGASPQVRIDKTRINISGHSQGGDAVLAALAISGEGSMVSTPLQAGSIASGCFGPRFEQLEIYGPMANTLQAFMSGDGTWTGTARSVDGVENPEFVFGFPPDWIGTVKTGSPEWTWQAQTWHIPTVKQSLQIKLDEMYDAINSGTGDFSTAGYRLAKDSNGRSKVEHEPAMAVIMSRIGGYGYPQFITEPLHLHHSDQDYYSPPRWNSDLAGRVNNAGGRAADFNYPQNTHSLLASQYEWFSSGEVVAGFEYMLDRDSALFLSGQTAATAPLPQELTSPEGITRYARTLSNQFKTEYERRIIDGVERRVLSFEADGLKQFALLLQPTGQKPATGWPVLLMSHGYHPNPPDNGKREDGTTDRPGDYYRGVPLAFAKQGFLVVWPDFRGHNVSEGLEFTQTDKAAAWYTRDLIAAFRALDSIPGANLDQVFLWGHSLGGTVTLGALPAIGSEIRGASIWSSWLTRPDTDAGQANLPRDLQTPLIIQHSAGDTSVSPEWSQVASKQLQETGRTVEFHLYPGENHLFLNEELIRAVERDIAFFRQFID